MEDESTVVALEEVVLDDGVDWLETSVEVKPATEDVDGAVLLLFDDDETKVCEVLVEDESTVVALEEVVIYDGVVWLEMIVEVKPATEEVDGAVLLVLVDDIPSPVPPHTQ